MAWDALGMEARLEALDPQLKAELTEVFKLFDREGDGQIDAKELGNVLWSLGLQPSKEEVEQFQLDMDVNKSGTVDLEEFLLAMTKRIEEEENKDEVEETFALLDKDGDGIISREDLALVLASLGERGTDRQRQLEVMMEEIRKWGCGVRLEEFRKIMGDLWSTT